jgi:hypothetical protein
LVTLGSGKLKVGSDALTAADGCVLVSHGALLPVISVQGVPGVKVMVADAAAAAANEAATTRESRLKNIGHSSGKTCTVSMILFAVITQVKYIFRRIYRL